MQLGNIVECKQCAKRATVMDGGHVHEALDDAGCTCCPHGHYGQEHVDHADPVTGTGQPCRPVTIYANAVVQLVQAPSA